MGTASEAAELATLRKWLAEIEYRDWSFTITAPPQPSPGGVFDLTIDAGLVVDVETGRRIELITTRPLATYVTMSKDHFIALVDEIVLDIEKHEHYEFFRVNGKRWQNPH